MVRQIYDVSIWHRASNFIAVSQIFEARRQYLMPQVKFFYFRSHMSNVIEVAIAIDFFEVLTLTIDIELTIFE